MSLYRYPLKEPWDSSFVRGVIERDVGLSCRITTQWVGKAIVIYFDRELTPEEKAKLDAIMASPPTPVSSYELKPLRAEDVEQEIGVRPARLTIDLTTGECDAQFDQELTPAQEAKLAELLRSPMRFKRLK